jgi:hypothetical protein
MEKTRKPAKPPRQSNPLYWEQDPALELGTLKHRKKPSSESSITSTEEHNEHIRRKEQPFVDRIVRGEEAGSYFLMVGSKVRIWTLF